MEAFLELFRKDLGEKQNKKLREELLNEKN